MLKTKLGNTYARYGLILAGFLVPLTNYSQTNNYAMSLPGGTDGSLSNIDISGLNITSLPYTIEMWVQPNGTQSQYAGLMYHRSTTNAGIQYAASWQGADKIRIMTNISGDYGTVTDAATYGAWHHIAAVVTATTRTIYLDGKAYSQNITNTNYDFSTGKLYIGWDNAVANRVFKGLVDEVRVWNTARTAEQIDTCKLKVLSGTEPGLVGYWNFDDQNATHATDVTGHGINGIINGGNYVASSYFYMSQKNMNVNSPSLSNNVALLGIVTGYKYSAQHLTKLYLNTNGTTSLSDISNVKIYYTGSDSTFGTSNVVAETGDSPSNNKLILNCNQNLASGANYFWIAYDVAANAPQGNLLDVECDSFVLAGADTNTYIPANKAPGGALTVNSGMHYAKFPADIVTSAGQTPTGGANFVSFQQNAIMTYNGYQYVTYWNNAYHVCLARKKLPTGSWEVVEFTDYTVTAARIADNHYSISMGICPNDGTIHLAFDHHGDNLHYRKSIADLANKPAELLWSAASFGSVQDYLISGQQMTQVTYPRFAAKPDGDLLYEYRYGTSGAGDSYIYEYAANTGTWAQVGKYMDGLTLGNNGYLNGIHYDANSRLHASWVWRETPDPLTNHDVCYMYSDDHGRTWMSHSGTQVGAVNTNPVKSNTSGITVWPLGQNRGLINQESQAVDSKGGIHILQSYLPDGEPNSTNFWNGRSKAYLRHIYKDESGTWQSDVIDAISVNRSEIAVDEGDNLYVVAPNYRVYYASAADKWQNWTAFDISESSSAINEGLVDRESLLNESVLSFVFAQTGGNIIVPYYLIDKSKPGKGTGLNVSTYGGANMDTFLTEKLDSINLISIAYSGDSVSIRCLGTLETLYAEAYTLQFTTSGDARIWINDVQVLNTGAVSTETTFPVTLNLQPSHKYIVKIEGKYAQNNVVAKLEWESERQARQLVPLSALYGSLSGTPTNLAKVTNKLDMKCFPNPFRNNMGISINGRFQYKLYDIRGLLVQEGEASNQLMIGEGLNNGVYILKVTQGENSKTVKVMKM
jgi:hypothetical protein